MVHENTIAAQKKSPAALYKGGWGSLDLFIIRSNKV